MLADSLEDTLAHGALSAISLRRLRRLHDAVHNFVRRNQCMQDLLGIAANTSIARAGDEAGSVGEMKNDATTSASPMLANILVCLRLPAHSRCVINSHLLSFSRPLATLQQEANQARHFFYTLTQRTSVRCYSLSPLAMHRFADEGVIPTTNRLSLR